MSAANGYDFTPGGSFTVTYVSGLTSAFGVLPPDQDASGDHSYTANDGLGSSGNGFPSLFVDMASYPAYLRSGRTEEVSL